MPCVEELQDTCIALYTDRSKDNNGQTACHWVARSGSKQTTLLEGQCGIGDHAGIKHGEIQVIQEGLNALVNWVITGHEII